ncbi:MAG: ribosome-associated translation inhibitor RaiA [Beijerinckiaceae bacterium]|jgi:ribosomal subunit interface protein|nr:ribosome-associated translation inhibitor RaiA [Beijerinckiaceae bacterium]
MVLRVSGKNFDIGEALRLHVREKVEAASSKYFDGSVTGHVILDHEGSGYRCDCTLHLASGITLHSEGRAQEPYASFDQAAERLEKRLRRYKRRLKDHHTSYAASASAPAAADEMVADYVIEAPAHDADEGNEFHPIVIAERTSALKNLPVSEAVMELDFTGAPVHVFRHAGNGRVNIVYRRSDGNIGWIDTAAPEPAEAAGARR